MMSYNDKSIMFPMELFVDLINEKEDVPRRLLDFYRKYIKRACTITVFEDDAVDIVMSEDLEQEIKIYLVKSISKFRQKMISQLNENKTVIISIY